MVTTRLTKRFGLLHPIIQAPMAIAAGGKLAAAVCEAGGLGLIGGGYGDEAWLSEQFDAAGDQPVGCGLITWKLREQPHVLSSVLARRPAALFLSFGDPQSFVDEIETAGVPLICQIQTRRDALRALDLGVDIVVAQGGEAGGHGEKRGTVTLVPEVADLIANRSPHTLLCAAGGIGDGRGLAAALMLGADGVVVGSRFWASTEALVHQNMVDAAIASTGDDTIRSTVMDIARGLAWPARYTARVLRNGFTDRWHDDLDGLRAAADEESSKWRAAWESGDTRTANTFVGEAAGLIDSTKPAAQIVADIIKEAETQLSKSFA